MPMKKTYTADEFYALGLTEPCELINGKIVSLWGSTDPVNEGQTNISPSPNIRHQRLSSDILYEIKHYIRKNKGKCEVFCSPTDVKLSSGEVVVPDIFITCDPEKFDEQKYNGAPDLIIEIVSPHNIERDLQDKPLIYKNAGVREYWIVNPMNEKVTVFQFGQPTITEFYSFDDIIPMGIYKDMPEQLTICISDLENNR
ncbi:MAG: Uma2 family endonuclease [Oscillospiraceae bacterium]|nr:Uma2 family endonuclease [Oscillospiraceae bacterium]